MKKYNFEDIKNMSVHFYNDDFVELIMKSIYYRYKLKHFVIHNISKSGDIITVKAHGDIYAYYCNVGTCTFNINNYILEDDILYEFDNQEEKINFIRKRKIESFL